jgi:hypothetical protein
MVLRVRGEFRRAQSLTTIVGSSTPPEYHGLVVSARSLLVLLDPHAPPTLAGASGENREAML